MLSEGARGETGPREREPEASVAHSVTRGSNLK